MKGRYDQRSIKLKEVFSDRLFFADGTRLTLEVQKTDAVE